MISPIYILGGAQTDFARVWSREGLDLSDMIRASTVQALDDARTPEEDQRAVGALLLDDGPSCLRTSARSAPPRCPAIRRLTAR